MTNEEIVLTQNGLKKLESELIHLKSVKRKEVAAKIREAISYGDITDNSEYEDAKNEQAFTEGRIATLERWLRNARILKKEENDCDVVSLGSTVKLRDLEMNEDVEYTIVGTAEADPIENLISNESPVGRSLIGLPVGGTVEVKVPAGTVRYEVLEIK